MPTICMFREIKIYMNYNEHQLPSPYYTLILRTIYGTIFAGGDFMIAIASSQVRSNFKQVCDQVVNDIKSVIVTRTRGENVVIMSEEEYNNIMENFRIFSNPDIYNKIKNGIGKPEPLKHNLSGYWSRRINDEHRIIYKIVDNQIYIASCRDHY